jgi:hypothetical protein
MATELTVPLNAHAVKFKMSGKTYEDTKFDKSAYLRGAVWGQKVGTAVLNYYIPVSCTAVLLYSNL